MKGPFKEPYAPGPAPVSTLAGVPGAGPSRVERRGVQAEPVELKDQGRDESLHDGTVQRLVEAAALPGTVRERKGDMPPLPPARHDASPFRNLRGGK